MGKTVVAPLIGFIFLTLQLFFGVEVSKDIQDQVQLWAADGIALGMVLYGIFKNHKK